jgi:lipoate---protein ligase
MKYAKLTFPTPEENLACDEALLDLCEGGYDCEILRLWESKTYFVVLGYSTKIYADVNLDFCRQEGIPILRRFTGGGAVLQGPGCLNYTLVLNLRSSKALNDVAQATAFVMKRQENAFKALLGTTVRFQGISDLTIGQRKFSGNAQHRKRRFLLFHGTLLLHLDILLLERVLPVPSRQPAYRQNRSHSDFLVNLSVGAEAVEKALKVEWRAMERLETVPYEKIEEVVRNRYARPQWNFKF